MKKTLRNSKFLTFLVLLTISLAILHICMICTMQMAYAENIEDLTTLKEYIQNEYRTESSFDRSGLLISVSGDDPIVQYVPKEYFMQEGQHLYIGDDYGYYIYTFPDGMFEIPSGNFESYDNLRSIVLGFEIKYEQFGDASDARDGFSYSIKPVFQREYATLMPDGINEVGIGDYSGWNDFSRTTMTFRKDVFTHTMACALTGGATKNAGIVFPVPTYSLTDDFCFDDVNVFYLTDLVVSARIENAQELNHGDTGYIPEEDDGCFLIGTGFEISALEYVVGETDLTGFAIHSAEAVTKELITTILGFLPGGSIISGAIDVIDYLIDSEEFFERDYFEEAEEDSYYRTTDIPNSKNAQLQNSGNLYRAASIQTQNSDGTGVWLGNNDNFKAVFEIGSGAGNEVSWWTAAYHAISARVTSLFYDLESVTTSSTFYGNFIHQSRDKVLAEDVESEAYIISSNGNITGLDSFIFTAPRNGFYTLTIGNSAWVSYQVKTGDTVCQQSYEDTYYFSEGQEYVITLSNTSTSLKRPTIEIGLETLEGDFGDSYSVNLPAGDETYFRVDLVNPFTNLSVQGTGIQIVGVSNRLDIILTELSGTSYDIKSENVSVILIKNTSSVQQSANIVFSDLSQIQQNGTSNIEISGDIRYFKFIPQAASYIFRYTETDGAAVNLTFFSPGSATAIKSIESDYVLVTGLTTGSTYWVGLYNAYDESADITLVNEAQEGSIQWLVNDEVITGDKYTMYNGQTYDVALLINGEKYYAWIESATNAGQQYLTYQNNSLIVANYSSDDIFNTGIRYEIVNTIFTGIGNDTIDGVLDIDLKNPVNYVKSNNLLSIIDTLSKEVEVDVYLQVDDPLIDQIDYQVTYENGLFQDRQISGTVDIGVLANDNVQIITFGCSDLIVYSPLIKITGIVYDGYEYAYSSVATQSTFSIRYGKGSGTAADPYIINCLQHYLTFTLDANTAANNNEYKYWQMASDVNIAGMEIFQVQEFYGSFDGDGHTISGLEIVIDAESFQSDQSFGWVKENYGTIKNLTFSDVSITGAVWHQGAWAFVGTVCGINHSGGLLKYISVMDVNISVNRSILSLGGITGVNQGTLDHCWFGEILDLDAATIFSNGDMGGICGTNRGTLNCCYFFATMEYYPCVSNRSVGGIVGYSPSGSIENCYVCGTFTIIGSDANIYPNIGIVAGHITSLTVISDIIEVFTINLDELPASQRVNACADDSRLYGYMG